jgi:hypothetical protein
VKAFKRAKTKLQLKSEVVTVPRIGVVIYFSVMMNGRGHVLLSWNSVNLVLPLPTNHSRHRRTELDSCCLIQEDTGPIRFGTMTNYREVVAVLKDRGRVLLRIGLFRIVFKWVKPGFLQTFIDIDGTELDSLVAVASFGKISVPSASVR